MNDFEKLKSLIEEIDVLIQRAVTSHSPEFIAWKTKTGRFLSNKYGQDSFEFTQFSKTSFSLGVYAGGTPRSEFVRACKNGLTSTKAVLSSYLDDIADEQMDTASIAIQQVQPPGTYQSVFIVHGHATGLKEAVARMLERQGINAIILQEQVNAGATIIEKFEANSDVDAAICLFTADDVGGLATSEKRDKRARQNVVLETGFFIGKLGRKRVIIIKDPDIEIPSDLDGVVSTKSSNWKISVLQDLKYIGYNVDFNKEFC